MLVNGTAKLCISDDNGVSKEVLRIGEGDFFGERGLMTGEPRAASVIADSELECYRLSKSAFQDIVQSRPDLVDDISRTLASRLGALERARQQLGEEAAASASSNSDLSDRIRRFFGMTLR